MLAARVLVQRDELVVRQCIKIRVTQADSIGTFLISISVANSRGPGIFVS
jgi:hypothetical protein